ncbi:Transcriptional regulator, LysR family protein (fragment) [Hyella patelloides LEGE 07179]|uniref:Transcriptional regulator, LysR family protein n=1 Tax=Hyella patelloides LEGE 07179 TaxID=945734 RepID=A0A563VK11_9CYAN
MAANSQINNLADHSWIGAEDSLAQALYSNKLQYKFPGVKFHYRVNTLVGILTALNNDMGVGTLFCFMGDTELNLQRVHPPITELAKDLWLLTHPDLRQVARIKIFIDFIANNLKPKTDLIEGKVCRDKLL